MEISKYLNIIQYVLITHVSLKHFVSHSWHLTDSKTDFVTLLHRFTRPP